jgi:hypothetical protein
VFAITGLKLKGQSPFETTMNLSLANGSEGYIPPPEQHALGGYTTWPARTAGLEVQAEPKIVATVLGLLEQVAGKPRRALRVPGGPYAEAVLASRPLAYWRLDDVQGPTALDSTNHGGHAAYEGGVAYFLPGADAQGLSSGPTLNRAVHFAGGRLKAGLDGVGQTFSIELWFWNGLPSDVRPIAGHLLAFGTGGAGRARGGRLGIGGTHVAARRLFFSTSQTGTAVRSGKTEIAPRTWHHLALVRAGRRITVYLDGKGEPELDGEAEVAPLNTAGAGPGSPDLTLDIGGPGDGDADFEGKIDEVAVYDRPLDAAEIAAHVRASGSRSGSTTGSSR